MKVLQITAGAAGMFCGSCTRDNALARALIARGHDVTLVPVYTPTTPGRAERQSRSCAVRRNQRLPAAALCFLQKDASHPRPPAGFSASDRRVRRPRHFDRRAHARRPDDLDARGGARSAAEGVREAGGMDPRRAAARCDHAAEFAADRAGRAAETGLQPSGVLPAAGRGALHRRARAAVLRAGAGDDSTAGRHRRSVSGRQRLLQPTS